MGKKKKLLIPPLEKQKRYEIDILNNIENFKWGCFVGKTCVVYLTFTPDNSIVVYENHYDGSSRFLINDHHPIIKHDKKTIFSKIKKTKPKKLPWDLLAKYGVTIKNTISNKTVRKESVKNRVIKKKNDASTLPKQISAKQKADAIRAKQEANRTAQLPKEHLDKLETHKKELESKKREVSPIKHVITSRSFVIRRNVFKCMHNHHSVVDVDAIVEVVSDNGQKQALTIPTGYCRQCGIYFILESTYYQLRNKGYILCRISDEKTYMKSSFINGMQLAQESILMQYGYNVSQANDLSERERHKILAVLIDNYVMTKSEIISYLDFFISQRQSQSRYYIAISKWERDRDFVCNYRLGEFTKYGVNGIYRT